MSSSSSSNKLVVTGVFWVVGRLGLGDEDGTGSSGSTDKGVCDNISSFGLLYSDVGGAISFGLLYSVGRFVGGRRVDVGILARVYKSTIIEY